MKSFSNLFFAALAVCLVSGCEYDAEKFTSQKPVDFVYINNSDYKIDALLLKSESGDYDRLVNETTISLKPGERMMVVTNDPVDGNEEIYRQYIVIFNDSEFYSCRYRDKIGYLGSWRWNYDIPLYPSSYKVLSGTRENGHTVYEFTFTNACYDSARGECWVSDVVLTDESGVRYFKGWDTYDDEWNSGQGVMIDGLSWSPFDYHSNNERTEHCGYDQAMKSCPTGWRLPTEEEFKSLSANYSGWGGSAFEEDGIWFSGTNEYSSDVPSVRLRPSNSWSTLGHKVGKYWTSTKVSDDEAVAFTFDDKGEVGLANESVAKECLIRCVKSDRKKYSY